MGPNDFLMGMVQRQREVNEQTFFRCSEKMDGVKTLGWKLTKTHLSPPWLNAALPPSPQLPSLCNLGASRLLLYGDIRFSPLGNVDSHG